MKPLAIALCLLASSALADEAELPGEVRLYGGSTASFGDDRVVGPAANLTRRPDGTWAGSLGGANVDLSVKDGKILGAGVSLLVSSGPGKLSASGLYRGDRVLLEVSEKVIRLRRGPVSLELDRVSPGVFGKGGASGGPLSLIGDAARPELRPIPLLLALLAAFAP